MKSTYRVKIKRTIEENLLVESDSIFGAMAEALAEVKKRAGDSIDNDICIKEVVPLPCE